MSVDFNVIKSSVSIVDVCRDYVEYVKQDHEKMWSKCPFHSDDTPSFVVNFAGEYAGRFHCYGCNVDGDVIDFVERIEHCTKPEAALRICEKFAPRLLTDDNGKFKRQINKAKRVADDERNELINAAREVCGVVRQRSEKQADNYKAALDNGTYTIDSLYTMLRTEGANSTAEKIERKYHPEYFEEETKRGRGRPTKESLTFEVFSDHLQSHGYTARYNLITHCAVIEGMSLESIHAEKKRSVTVTVLYKELSPYYNCSFELIYRYLELASAYNCYNPVLELLNSLPEWDGHDRVNDLCDAMHIPSDDSLSRLLIKKFAIQAISLQYNNDPDNAYGGEGVLTFKGLQGQGKSRITQWFAMHGKHKLCSGLHKDGVTLTDDKDSSIAATGAWFAELGEVGGTFSKKNNDTLKSFITAKVDEIRRPYGHEAEITCRRTVFIATVNDEKFLADETGSRRWWVVNISEEIDWIALEKIDSFQFWKQIETYAKADPQSFRLTKQEREDLQKRNGMYEKNIPAENEVADIFAKAKTAPNLYKWCWLTTSDFAMHHERLSRYSDEILGRAITRVIKKYDCDPTVKTSITMEQKNEIDRVKNTTRGRYKLLPIPTSHNIYGSPSEIPPEDRVTLADSALQIAQEGLGR